MRYIKQLLIILLVSLLGELLGLILPLPIPASVYGLILMLLALQLKLVKLSQIEDVGNFLLDVMPLMFIPFAVGMLPVWPQLRALLIPLLAASILCTLLVMITSGWVTQRLVRKEDRHDGS